MVLIPLKRTYSGTDRSHSHATHPPVPLIPSQVKCEPSPSLLSVEKKPVTSGTRRFAPIPSDCLPSCTEYRQNRLKWVEKCGKELEVLNLIPERKLIRDDGLIIDWRSHVPVLSDTLQPDPQDLAATIVLAHRSNAQLHRSPVRKESHTNPVTTVSSEEHPTMSPPSFSGVPDAQPPLKKRVPVPPRPSSMRRSSLSRSLLVGPPTSRPNSPSVRPGGSQFSNETDHQAESHSPSRDSLAGRAPTPSDTTQHSQATVRPNLANRVGGPSVASYISSAGEKEMSEMTLNYLYRYVQTYEADRASLASAYARNASFAYRVHRLVQNIGKDASSMPAGSPESFSSGTKLARLEIVTSLLTLPKLHSDAQQSNAAQLQYDIFYLGADLGMFIVCRVVTSTRTVAHNFILQRKEADLEDAATEGVWPLMATAHQILVFQT